MPEKYVKGLQGSVSSKAVLTIFPNPVAEFLELKMAFKDLQHGVTVKIYNRRGQQVYGEQLEPTLSLSKVIPTSDLPPDLYLIKVITDDHVYTEKIIKK